ncbi:FKBP-type peptidyl-prolyl cis-trans isomerase [Sphingobacterium prati]|uniref:FKBP-type peptidyl-prolyl cis-trans isomerase n=1 Tax=Sphingobacterium prati TaxID=2737006 RepID=UPI001556B7B1|nr:FKBP-type peptidyl-prolyl cis-trans isomerase [Sphingobacterium prati]NPE49132.1 peptidylprolyl isomerase [Sphingobacterium prati]
MKKILSPLFLGIAAIALFTVSCAKSDDTPVYDAAAQFKTDSVTLKNYVDSKFPDAQYDSGTGIWYEILTEGEGNYQYKIVDTLNAKFLKFKPTVKYTGRLLSGSIFDQTETDKTTTFEILTNTGYYYPFESTIIPAWTFAFAPKQIGDLKLSGLTEKGLQKGAKIHIMAPSRWTYGNRATGKIPANSPLDFVIEVVDLK